MLSAWVALFVLVGVQGHICLIEPHQRGAMNISGPAEHDCFRRYPNCGGIAAGPPTATYIVNKPARVLFQQNLNHWNQDKPGYLDLSVSYDNEASWEVLKTLGDFPGNDMVQQTNFTFDLVFSKVASHAILRLRYVSYNKYEVYPKNNTDAVFYQCSDIKVVAGPEVNATVAVEKPKEQTRSPVKCSTPQRWMATTESNLQRTKIWYDATGPIVRWDRTMLETGVTGSFVTNYTVTPDGIMEYGFWEDSKTCEAYGADAFYPWEFSTIASIDCHEEEQAVHCADPTSGLRWGAKRDGATCLPSYFNKQHEFTRFTSARAVDSFDPATFAIPPYCNSPSLKKISCHPQA